MNTFANIRGAPTRHRAHVSTVIATATGDRKLPKIQSVQVTLPLIAWVGKTGKLVLVFFFFSQ
jgi:hypothetical protein